MLHTLRWVLPAIAPAFLVLLLVYRTDEKREPIGLVLGTFSLGAAGAYGTAIIEGFATAWSGLDIRASVSGDAGALLFLFGFVAPVRELTKAMAAWPAFRSKNFDEDYDGLVYSNAAALGFAAMENASYLRVHGFSNLAFIRTLLAVPAHAFFAAAWGYAMGRNRRMTRPGVGFRLAWLGATLGHALYIHFVFGRGASSLFAVAPMLLAMAALWALAARDLNLRGERDSWLPRDSRISLMAVQAVQSLPAPPTLREVREGLRSSHRTVQFPWVFMGALTMFGAILMGGLVAVAIGYATRVDFSRVSDDDIGTATPVMLLATCVLASFPVSGFLSARGAGISSLLETSLAALLVLAGVTVLLGMAAPVAAVFWLAMSPVAFGLACLGAWFGRTAQ